MRSAAQNNGKITGQTDNISGEQVVYTYDALNRLATAENRDRRRFLGFFEKSGSGASAILCKRFAGMICVRDRPKRIA